MSANLQPISSDGGFVTGGNIDVSNYPVSSPAPYINGFSSVEALDQLKIGDARFYSNGTITNSTLRVDATTLARLSVVDPNTVFNTYFQAVENYANIYVANGSGDATWRFTSDGNLTLPGNTFSVNYANGTQVSIGGGGGSYGDSNVANFLGAYGSNTISTTGNISGGNIIASANVLGNGYARFVGSFDESQASTAGLYLGYAGGTPRMMFGTGNTSQTFEVDNDGGNLRFYQPGSTKATLTSGGNFSVSGNITAANLGNIASANLNGNGSQVFLGNGTFASIPSSSTIANGNSNVNIATANGNVTISAVGNNVVTITGTSANITGIANVTGNVIAGSNSTTGFILGNVNSKIGIIGSNATITMSQNVLVTPDQSAAAGAGLQVGGGGYILAPNGARVFTLSGDGSASVTTNLSLPNGGTFSTTGPANIGGTLTRNGAVTSTAWGTAGVGLKIPTSFYTDNSSPAGTIATSYIHSLAAPTLVQSNAVTITNAATLYVVAPTAGSNATITNSYALVANGSTQITGTATTGVNSILAGPSFTPLANTVAGFNSNVNSYTQVTLQNKSTGADATTDYVLTADNGSDTVNYGDFGIINSGYDNGTPTNSLGNIVYAADTYLYAQGNTGNSSQSGGNLAIGTTVPGKNVKIFAGGVDNTYIVANISNTGVAVTGNLSATGNITANNFSGNISITGNVTGTSSNVTLVAGSYSYTFDNAGIMTLPAPASGNEGGEIDFTKAANSTLSGNIVAIDQYVDRIRFFEGGGTTRGAYIDLTQAAAGVGTLLNNRVSGLVNAGTFVTMDLLKATVTSSGNRGLSLAATTGSFAINIGGTFAIGSSSASGGSAGTATITTTASASQFNWNFTSQSDTSIYTITDTTNSRAYRITLQIGGSYLNNLISIERLV